MSESDSKKPKLQAGDEIIDRCPVCQVKFAEAVESNINHTCPNPQCNAKFCVMVFEE